MCASRVYPEERRQSYAGIIMPPHLDALFRLYSVICMRKLERIIGDPPIDHVRETRNDRPRQRQGDGEKGVVAGRKGRKKEISEGDRERFISSSKGSDRFMNPIDCSVKKKRHKISSRYAPCFACETVCTFRWRNKTTKFNLVFFSLRCSTSFFSSLLCICEKNYGVKMARVRRNDGKTIGYFLLRQRNKREYY